MLQQRALAASAAPHDDEDIAVEDRKAEIALNDKIPVGHIQVFHRDMWLGGWTSRPWDR